MSNCRICAYKTKLVINFRNMPIANGFIQRPNTKEYFYPLRLLFCPQCYMVQLEQNPQPRQMFNASYHYISSTSKQMQRHFYNQAQEIIKLASCQQKNPFIVELGSNDGIMLKHIARRGINHLGIEPASNVAKISQQHGVKTWSKFFNLSLAKQILKTHGPAQIISAANTLCSVVNLNSAFAGFHHLLDNRGILLFEDPYIYDIIKITSFDQIYDEHVYYFSGLSVRELGKRHQLKLFDMKHQNVHGGSMRYYLSKDPKQPVNPRVYRYIHQERQLKLHQFIGYAKFRTRVHRICSSLKNTLKHIKKHHRLAGYGATSKSTTLLNFAKIGPELIDYISDNTPGKIGKFTPGTHIPIKSNRFFAKDKPDYTVLFAWNHQQEIFAKEKKYLKLGGKFITYFPQVKIHSFKQSKIATS